MDNNQQCWVLLSYTGTLVFVKSMALPVAGVITFFALSGLLSKDVWLPKSLAIISDGQFQAVSVPSPALK